MTQYLLSLAIGPVQPFIATARRTQDLWMGSRLLSDLMQAGINEIRNETELIFPNEAMVEALKDNKERGGLSHKFLVLCDDPNKVASDARKGIEAAWVGRAEKVWQYLSEKNAFKTDQPIGDPKQRWKRQIDPKHLFEFYWAAVSYNSDNYQKTYRLAGRMLAARKTIRNFEPVEEPGRKCSVCGERQGFALAGLSLTQVKPNEWLCAICAIKRFDARARAKSEDELERFPSTSTVAVAPYLDKLLTLNAPPEISEATINFQLALKTLESEHPGDKSILTHSSHSEAIPALSEKGEEATRRLDGDLFFPETFSLNGRLKNDYGFSDDTPPDKIKAVICALQKLREAMQAWAGIKPSPYFATLVMDGDRMGKRLSEVKTQDGHQDISQRLFEFTQEIEQIVNKHLGRLVYAGGDDVFAFLPVETALPAANEIRQAFGHKLEAGQMSAGIAIAHHLAPLSFIRQQAHSAEKSAKNEYRRNALCVTLLKRSGAPLTVGARWSSCVIEIVQDLVVYFKNRRLSGKLVYEVGLSAATLAGEEIPREAKVAELRRLLRRHRAKNCPDNLKPEIDQLAERLVNLAGSIESAAGQTEPPHSGMVEMAGWLKLAHFLAGGGGQDE